MVSGSDHDTDYSYDNGVLTIKTDTALTIKNADQNTPTTDRIVVDCGDSANIYLGGVNIDVSENSESAFSVYGSHNALVNITIEDGTLFQRILPQLSPLRV